jgi:hypothetical protein
MSLEDDTKALQASAQKAGQLAEIIGTLAARVIPQDGEFVLVFAVVRQEDKAFAVGSTPRLKDPAKDMEDIFRTVLKTMEGSKPQAVVQGDVPKDPALH